MIRIKANRCGYDQYKCKGIPQIGEDSNGMFDTNVSIVASMKAEFNKLPIRIKGMVFSEDTTNMSWPDGGPHPEVAEISCRTDTDPWSDSEDVSVWNDTDRPLCVAIGGHTYQYPVYSGNRGWTDLYNAEDGNSENPRYFYRNTVVGSTNAVASDVYIIADGHHWHNIYRVGTSFGSYNGIPDFTSDINDVLEDSIEMGPGLLEPMLDTEFDPVNIDVIPAWEAGDDGLILSNILLNDWKNIIDDRIQNIYARINSIHPGGGVDQDLLDLINQDNSVNECASFMITLVNGAALQDKRSITENTYSVSYSSILVNGIAIDIIPLSGLTFYLEPDDTVMYVWLVIDEEEEPISGAPYTVSVIADPEDPSEAENAPENRHVYLIGGVIRIDGDPGDYVLFKIFQEECISEVNFGGGGPGEIGVIVTGQNGEIIVPIEGSTYTPSPGIVQRSANIWYDPHYEQSSQDVPTVEAVYNFIHGIEAYGGGVANALATAETIVGAVGGTVYSDTTAGSVRTVYRDRADQLPSEQQLSDLSVASSMLEAAEAAWELDGEPTSGDIWEAYQEALYNYNYAYAVAYYGAAEAGEPGTVYTINCIAISNGTAIKVDGTIPVPTADAVHAYVHDVYALSTPGTVSTESTPHVASQGTPGTVFTIDALDTSAYEGGSYMDCQVPTVKAVIDYVKGIEGATDAIPAAISGGTEYVDIEGATEHSAGIVQSVVNIYVAGTVPTDLSDTAVPTVKAIHEYIHCTGSSNYDWSSSLATTGTMGSTVSVPATTAGVNGETVTAPAVYGSTVAGAVPGTVIVVENIDLTGEDVDLDIVPTVLAVVDYIDSLVPVPGYIEVSGGNETWRQGSDDPEPLEGLVFVAVNIDAGTAGVAHEAVPTVAAVKTYVDSVTGATTAVAGKIIESGSPATQSVVDVASGITHTVGVVQPVRNIFIGANGTVAQETVPTVDAIYNFVHDIEVSGMSFATARASIATMGSTVSVPATTAGVNGETVTTPAVYGSTITDAESGTVLVVGNIDISGNDVPTDIVPTVLAVTGYIDTLVPVAGTISVASGMESWVDASIVRKGLVYTSTNVDAGTAGIAHEAVPTVAAVKAYVDGYVPAEAVPEALGQGGNFPITGSTASPGIVYVASTLVSGDTDSDAEYAVPTVNAVAGFISGYLAVSGELDESTGNWVSGSTNSPGIVDVATNVVLGATDSNAASAVPTVRAVAEYVATHGGGYTGAFAGTKNENGTVNIGPGHAYFGGTTWSFAGVSNLSLANGATKFAECAKGTSTITLRDTNTTDLTKATFPLVGKDSSGNLIQCQYGDINIVGRWM